MSRRDPFAERVRRMAHARALERPELRPVSAPVSGQEYDRGPSFVAAVNLLCSKAAERGDVTLRDVEVSLVENHREVHLLGVLSTGEYVGATYDLPAEIDPYEFDSGPIHAATRALIDDAIAKRAAR